MKRETILLLILISFNFLEYKSEIYAQTSTETLSSARFLFNINGGISYSNNDDKYSSNLDDQKDQMSLGYVFGTEINYLLTGKVAVGLIFNYHKSNGNGRYGNNDKYQTPIYELNYYGGYNGYDNSPDYVDIDEKESIYFTGLNFSYFFIQQNKQSLSAGIALGYLRYRYLSDLKTFKAPVEESVNLSSYPISSKSDILGNTIGLVPSFSYSYKVYKNISAYSKLSFTLGKLSQYKIKDDYHENYYSLELDKDDYIKICKGELSLGLRLEF